jgi:hypothetical protein
MTGPKTSKACFRWPSAAPENVERIPDDPRDLGHAMFASLILKASDDIVFSVLLVGCLTAFLEIKMRNENRD